MVLPDNPYTRGMIAKVAHIVTFEEVAAQAHAAKPAPADGSRFRTRSTSWCEAAVATTEKAPRKKKADEGGGRRTSRPRPRREPARTRTAAKNEE